MFSKKVKLCLVYKDMKQKDLAEKIGTVRTNITNKLSSDNFSEKDMQSIANALNCELVIKLIDKETGQEFQYECSVNDMNCRKVFGGKFQI